MSVDFDLSPPEVVSVPAGAVPVTTVWSRVRAALVGLLDLVLAGYGLALLLLLATGGGQIGPLSLTQPAKPVLVLALLIPLRLALPDRSRLFGAMLSHVLSRTRVMVAHRTGVSAALLDVTFALVVTRIGTFAIAFMANLLFSASRPRTFSLPFERSKFIETFVAWDSGWYFDIARRGYYFDPDGQSSIAFFPLYPLLVRACAWPFGGSERAVWIAGILVSCSAFAAAVVVLPRFAASVFGNREAARRTVLYLALFPFSVFFTRVYAEALLLLTSVLAVHAAWHGRWATAGVWGALATLARPNGILIAVPLLLLALRTPDGLRTIAIRLAWLLPVPTALAGYCLYVYGLAGHPLAWLSSQAHWGYSLGHPPWEQLLKLTSRLIRYGPYDYFFVSPLAPYRLLHGAAAFLFLAITPAVFARLGVALGSYVLASLLVPLSGSALEGIGRYAAVLFPVFMVLGGRCRSQRLHEMVLLGFALFLTFMVTLFVTQHPIY